MRKNVGITIVIISLLFFLNIQGKADGIYKAKDYDISPNGVGIALKLESLLRDVSSSGGGVILFESGEYIIDAGLSKDGTPQRNIRLYPNVSLKGVVGTVFKANVKEAPFHSLFSTYDHSVENVVFENITFNTYIGKNNNVTNDYRLAIALHWCKNVAIRNCRFIHDIGTIETRYSHAQVDKDNGDFRVDGLLIENCIFEGRLLYDTGYRDITSLGICAQNVIIRNNKFFIRDTIKSWQEKYYLNCCMEIQGKDFWIYGNEFKDYTNAIDFTTTESYAKNRNINIYNNRFLTYRGIALWCGHNRFAKGFYIHHNTFNLNCEAPSKRVTGVKGCVVLVSHPTDSDNGTFSNITISNNIFDYSDNQTFYSSLSYNNWIMEAQHKTDEKSGMTFEEFYSVIALGGSSQIRDTIDVIDNEFKNCLFPCIYVGGRNKSENHLIKGNKFYDCGNDRHMYIVSLNNECDNIIILDNTIIDSEIKNKTKSGHFFQAKWAGLKLDNYSTEENISFNKIVVLNNRTVNMDNVAVREYDSDFSELKKGKNNVY